MATIMEFFVLRKEGIRHADVNCIFLSDAEIQRINKKYLRHNYPTDVISFTIDTDPVLEAELYIGLDVARRQAKEYRVLIREEILRLVVHGILHLCGYDDKEDFENFKQHLLCRILLKYVLWT